MRSESHNLIFYFVFLGLIFNQSCSPEKSSQKIVYINSYHPGHPSSDEIMQGFMDNMPGDRFKVYAWYMDTKRNPEQSFIEDKAKQLFDSVNMVDPDLLVVSDDNAVKYLVEPNLDELNMPVIFCGVNWSDLDYNLPKDKVTGILEILPVEEALRTIKSFDSSSEKLLVLSENTTTSRKEEQILDTLFQRVGYDTEYKLVDNFEQWQKAFAEGNLNYDVIYISTHAAIKGWDHEQAVNFVEQNIEIPTFTCEDFMMPYAVLGVTKIASEHGEWAAATAKRIFSGSSPTQIPVTRNRQVNYWLNRHLVEKIGFHPDSTLIAKATILNENVNE